MSNHEFFDRFEALTFDDVVIVPGYSDVLPDTVDTTATFAADITLNVPIVSAAMDKVTEARMAIAAAREGGIGVIHRNLSIEDQAAEVTVHEHAGIRREPGERGLAEVDVLDRRAPDVDDAAGGVEVEGYVRVPAGTERPGVS